MDGLVPGRIVYFVFDEKSAAEVMRRRTTGLDIARRLKEGIWPCGAQAHIGNSVFKGTVAPAAVVAVHVAHPNNSVNLKVLIDWADEYWAQNVPFDSDKQPGSWHWMFDGQQKRYTPDRTA